MMPADPARIATARALLAQLGVTLADLQADERPRVPTMAEYLPRVMAAAGPGARRTYGTYWIRMAAVWGDRPLNAITANDIEALQHGMAATARSRRNSLYRARIRCAWLTCGFVDQVRLLGGIR
jgi:hypothetical protein